MAQQGYLQLGRVELHSHVELSAIWRENAGLEYWLRTETGVMMQINSQDALTLTNMIGHGARYKSQGIL